MILGVNSYTHDISVALISEESPVMLLEEERLSRRKHHDGFVFFGGAPSLAVNRVLEIGEPELICHSHVKDHSAVEFNLPERRFRECCTVLDPTGAKTHYFEHHHCHAASAFFCSPFEKAYIVTLDSRGDSVSCGVFIGDGDLLIPRFLAPASRSICAGYSYASELVGFGRRAEGSLMGLAACGTSTNESSRLFSWLGNTFGFAGIKELETRCSEATCLSQKAAIASWVQNSFEEAIQSMMNDICNDHSIRDLALAGGGFLNARLVQKLSESQRWQNVFVQPAAGDSGTALGAALLALDRPSSFSFEHPFWGTSYSERELKNILEDCGLKPTVTDTDETAELLSQGLVGGYFTGRMEFGPRSLGHRSILADPRSDKMRERLNIIKGRQPWRPVAPSVLHLHGSDWFERYAWSPWMTRSFQTLPAAQHKIPAVVHVDGTARLQSVDKGVGRLYDVLESFRQITGVPILCNTSLNGRNQPIACSPLDAIAFFFTSGLDFLVLEKWMLKK